MYADHKFPKTEGKTYKNRLSRLLKSKSDFLKIKKSITDENLHRHHLLDIRFGLGAGGKPYKYMPPAGDEGTSGAAKAVDLPKSPSPHIDQDDEDLNAPKGGEVRGNDPKKIPDSEGQSSPKALPPTGPTSHEELTEEQILGELDKIPLPDEFYTQEDLGNEPLFPDPDEAALLVGDKENIQTSQALDSGPLGGLHGIHKSHTSYCHLFLSQTFVVLTYTCFLLQGR